MQHCSVRHHARLHSPICNNVLVHIPGSNRGKEKRSNIFILLSKTVLTKLLCDITKPPEYSLINHLLVAPRTKPHTPYRHIILRPKQSCHILSIHVGTLGTSSRKLQSTHTDTHALIYGSGRQSRLKLPRKKRNRRRKPRFCPKPLCPLQVEISMTLGFCYLSFCFSRHEKSDVATNPKSLSHSDLLSLPSVFLSSFFPSLKHTHSLFSSCCNSRSAIRLLLRTSIYTETEQTRHQCICTCACTHKPLHTRGAWSHYSSSWVWRST